MIALPDFLLVHPELLSSLSDRWISAKGIIAGGQMSEVMSMSTDALSDVLSAVRLSGSVFFDVTAKSPWVAEAPPGAQIANDVTPGAQHAIEQQVVTRRWCWLSRIGDARLDPGVLRA